jgi:hypothetical protein
MFANHFWPFKIPQFHKSPWSTFDPMRAFKILSNNQQFQFYVNNSNGKATGASSHEASSRFYLHLNINYKILISTTITNKTDFNLIIFNEHPQN